MLGTVYIYKYINIYVYYIHINSGMIYQISIDYCASDEQTSGLSWIMIT